jgi:hypothetical protein
MPPSLVIPAKAGILEPWCASPDRKIPAFAGMTTVWGHEAGDSVAGEILGGVCPERQRRAQDDKPEGHCPPSRGQDAPRCRGLPLWEPVATHLLPPLPCLACLLPSSSRRKPGSWSRSSPPNRKIPAFAGMTTVWVGAARDSVAGEILRCAQDDKGTCRLPSLAVPALGRRGLCAVGRGIRCPGPGSFLAKARAPDTSA